MIEITIDEMVRREIMTMQASDLEIRRIVTDSDLDGVVTAAILRLSLIHISEPTRRS